MIKNIIYVLTLKKVPYLYWSSNYKYNLKPNKITLFYLIIGVILIGIGEALIISSNIGVSPWFVLHQGLSVKTGYTIGITTFAVSLSVLILWLPFKEMPGIGTILNAIFISLMVDISLIFLPHSNQFIIQIFQVLIGVFLCGIGSGLYLAANLGAGPRDGLMTGINKQTNLSFFLIRSILEISVVLIGFYLGGIVGIGTIIYVISIGFSVSLGLFLVGKIFEKKL